MISQVSPSSFRSSPPCSSTMSISFSSVAADFSTAITPFFENMKRTEPDSPRLPPFFEKAWRISLTARLRLSVSDIDDDGDAAGAVALKGDLFVADAFQLAGAALDGALDVVLRHVLGLGGQNGGAQPRIAVRIAAALGGDGDFLDQAGEDLAALGVERALLVLDCGPF